MKWKRPSLPWTKGNINAQKFASGHQFRCLARHSAACAKLATLVETTSIAHAISPEPTLTVHAA